MMKRLTSLVPIFCLLFVFPVQSPQPQMQEPLAVEQLDASANYDWDADGKPDHFSLHVQKELDYSSESEKTSKEKFLWYHCWLSVKGTKNGTEIWRDEWSVKDGDMSSFKEMADFFQDTEYFQRWFAIPNNFENGKILNRFERVRLAAKDIDSDVLTEEIARLKIPHITPRKLRELITSNASSRSFCYRATWREDLRCAVYVPQLQHALLYQNGYR